MHLKKVNDESVGMSNTVNELGKFFNVATKFFPVMVSRSFPTGNSSFVNTGANQELQESAKMIDVKNMYGSATAASSASCSNNQVCCKNGSGLDALENCGISDDTTTPKFPRFPVSKTLQTDLKDSDFKAVLERRRLEEGKSAPSQKCKVVVRASQEINQVSKSAIVRGSLTLLEQIKSKLNKEDFFNFKIALSKFYAAVKSSDAESKIKYYKCMRHIFQDDLVFFAEIEVFIRFSGHVKTKESACKATANVLVSVQNGASKRKAATGVAIGVPCGDMSKDKKFCEELMKDDSDAYDSDV
jgi:hypothetical protein